MTESPCCTLETVINQPYYNPHHRTIERHGVKLNNPLNKMNFIKKIIKLIEAKNRIIVPDLGREGWGVAYQCV